MPLKRKAQCFTRAKWWLSMTMCVQLVLKDDEAYSLTAIKILTADITKGTNRDILLSIDFTGCTATMEVVSAFKQSATEVKPFVRK